VAGDEKNSIEEAKTMCV